MIIVTWNCQVMGSRHSHCVLTDIVKMHRPDVLVLVETKISGEKEDSVCARLHFKEWAMIECHGLSGGL